jgi:hypothetical protein
MSASRRRLAVSTAAASVLFVAMIGAFSGSAQAAPYTAQPTVSVSDETPTEGGTLTLTGQGFGSSEDVNNTLHTVTYPLTSAHTDAAGNFSVVVTLPAGVTGTHTIVSAGVTSGRTASVTITIGAPSTGGAGGGGLSNTGVAVIGIAGVGVLLLIGGGTMLLAGKRRKVSA